MTKNFIKNIILPFWLLLFYANGVCAQNTDISKIKAIQTFSQFIEWPAEKHLTSKQELFIYVIGNKTDIALLQQEYLTQRIKNLEVKIYSEPEKLNQADILVIYDTTLIKETQALQDSIQKYKILCITQQELNKAFEPATIHFSVEANEIQYMVNYQSALSMGYKINHLFLKQAKKVY